MEFSSAKLKGLKYMTYLVVRSKENLDPGLLNQCQSMTCLMQVCIKYRNEE
jgi:hypothetical protein